MTKSDIKFGDRHDIHRGSELFPEALEIIDEPPDCLHVIGNVDALNGPALAIVGARKATPYGRGCAIRFAKRAAQGEITIVSGGAIGCDQSAHRGALDAGGRTIVVLGCGADVVYPTKAKELFTEVVAGGGALVSELPWGAPPLRWAFLKRNRLIAALSQATLIVEAGLPSGTFSTADAALRQGKEVWVVPGSIFSKESRGSNHLIVQGAVPIVDDESFQDALNCAFGCLRYATNGSLDNPGSGYRGPLAEIMAALSAAPSRPEELVGCCAASVAEVICHLSALELAGAVERLRDGRYVLGAANMTANR